jgi:hypothetical protein
MLFLCQRSVTASLIPSTPPAFKALSMKKDLANLARLALVRPC